jgi:hypothetical protein
VSCVGMALALLDEVEGPMLEGFLLRPLKGVDKDKEAFTAADL